LFRLAPGWLWVCWNSERKTSGAPKRSQKRVSQEKLSPLRHTALKYDLRDGTLEIGIVHDRTEGSALASTLGDILPKTAEAIHTGIRLNWNPGAQLCVWHDDDLVVDSAEGYAAHGVPMRPDSINLWFSSGKPIAAVAVALLKQDGLLDFDAPVATYWPEFAQGGKEAITTRHILTHTSGMRTAEIADGSDTHDDVLSVIAAARIERNWEPGKRAGYHPTSGWHALGELVRRLSGVPYEVFTSEEIFAPLGMESSAFVISEREAAGLGDRLAAMHLSKNDELTPDPRFSVSATSRFVRPGGGLRSTAQDMVRFYRMLLGFGELEGTKILDPTLAAEITSPQRTGMKDETFGYMMDWGLGVMLDNKIHGPAAPYGYGQHASARTFGHGGRESSIAFGDPEKQLAVAVIFNGMPGELRSDRRSRPVLAAIYEDLGLA
jgi:CubicO group peptidase (beta-lactamase class C family)